MLSITHGHSIRHIYHFVQNGLEVETNQVEHYRHMSSELMHYNQKNV